jgi:DNA-binding protein HU-beta
MKTPKTPKTSKTKKTGPMTKAELVSALAARTEHSKAAIEGVLSELNALADAQIRTRGAFKVAGLVTFKTTERAARPARQGRSPKTGETIEIPAQPARKVVRARPDASLRQIPS